MLASPADPAGSTENRQARLSATRSDIHRARPDLTDESPELRAAVLLLLAGEIGFNVDRLVMRTRYPREFVARCTRRLVDNGVWTAGTLLAEWSSTPVDAPSFWWDVDVALGRRLR